MTLLLRLSSILALLWGLGIAAAVTAEPLGQGDRDCKDFRTWQEAQSFFLGAGPGDPHRLDSDHDGIACESLPGSPSNPIRTPTPTRAPTQPPTLTIAPSATPELTPTAVPTATSRPRLSPIATPSRGLQALTPTSERQNVPLQEPVCAPPSDASPCDAIPADTTFTTPTIESTPVEPLSGSPSPDITVVEPSPVEGD